MDPKETEHVTNNEEKEQENLPVPDSHEESGENAQDLVMEEEKVTEDTGQKDLQSKCDELNDKYLRLYSEFDNYRKRTAKEKSELVKTAGVSIITELLAVIDDFDRAIKLNEQVTDIEAVKHGVKLIHHKLNNILLHKGLEPMITIGSEFNPDLHEAITNVPAPSEDMKGRIIDELEKGFYLNGKVIRYAKVLVANGLTYI